MKKPDVRHFEKRDAFGNRFIASLFDTGHFRISIQLLSEKRTRLIGTVDTKNNILYVRRDRAKHLHYKTRTYGFNDAILRQEYPKIEQVCITDDRGTYILTTEQIFNHGKYLFFKQTGYEKQIFVPIEIIELNAKQFTESPDFFKE